MQPDPKSVTVGMRPYALSTSVSRCAWTFTKPSGCASKPSVNNIICQIGCHKLRLPIFHADWTESRLQCAPPHTPLPTLFFAAISTLPFNPSSTVSHRPYHKGPTLVTPAGLRLVRERRRRELQPPRQEMAGTGEPVGIWYNTRRWRLPTTTTKEKRHEKNNAHDCLCDCHRWLGPGR